jgi:hypothetical protein
MSSLSPNLLEVGPAQPASESQPARSAAFKAKIYAEFEGSGTETLYDTFEASCAKFAENPCIGYRPTDASGNVGAYAFYTYKETFDKVKAFASALRAAGVEKAHKVAVFGQNCCEWMIAMQARLSPSAMPHSVFCIHLHLGDVLTSKRCPQHFLHVSSIKTTNTARHVVTRYHVDVLACRFGVLSRCVGALDEGTRCLKCAAPSCDLPTDL